MTPSVSVIVVSYNTREMTLDCLRTLREASGASHDLAMEVIVVDNASTDGSVEAVREAEPDAVVIASDTNLGFGAANNLAMRQARGRYFLLLNSDAFVKPGAVATLIDYLDAHPTVGVVGPRLLNRDGTLQRSVFPFPTPGQAWRENLWLDRITPQARSGSPAGLGDDGDSAREVDWVVGACLLVRRETVEQVGGFDERFFMYAEETDWQKRIRAAGWAIAYAPQAEVTHYGGASGAPAKINRSFFDSLDYYERKHHGRVGLIALRLAMAVGCSLRAVGWSGMYLLAPARRETARRKTTLNLWLVARQLTHWRNAGAGCTAR